MKYSILFLFVLALVSCSEQKIGYVDNVKLMDGYQEKIDVEEKYKNKLDNLNRKRDSISQVFQLEAQEFQSRAEKMAASKAQKEYDILQQRGQFIGQQLQQEEQILQQQGQMEMDSVVQKVKEEIKAFGKSNKYTYILGGGEGGSVLYGQETDDLTEQVLKILNEKYKQ
ncbi:MAG: OmpH family outer membrane protein [Bacteroidia bacterium]|nr:OmpH family outer membrane protein [Bacteroidia bacterium]